MPARLEAALRRRAEQLKREGRLRDADAYVYGTMQRIEEQRKAKASG